VNRSPLRCFIADLNSERKFGRRGKEVLKPLDLYSICQHHVTRAGVFSTCLGNRRVDDDPDLLGLDT
jgi:hypothetical protein